MTALPRRQYRDPLEQMIEAEEESCKGCRWHDPAGGMDLCTRPKSPFTYAVVRCDKYEENA